MNKNNKTVVTKFNHNTTASNNNFQNPDERLVFNKVLDQVFLCQKDTKRRFTDFLQIAKAEEILSILLKHYNLYFNIFGGIDGASRVKIAIDFETITHFSDFPIKVIKIEFGKYAGNISHRHILGSIIGVGIERNKIGDILIFEKKAVVFLEESVNEFVLNNLFKIGSNRVKVSEEDVNDIFIPLDCYKELIIKLNKIRLSSLIAKCYNINRESAIKLVKSKKVFINWTVANKDICSFLVNTSISVRGYGKITVKDISEDYIKVHIYE